MPENAFLEHLQEIKLDFFNSSNLMKARQVTSFKQLYLYATIAEKEKILVFAERSQLSDYHIFIL